MNCKGCEFTKYPPCAIQSVYSSVDIEDIINEKELKKTLYPVCHKNAQAISGNSIIRTERCDFCRLCELVCQKKKAPQGVTEHLSDVVLSSIGHLNILLGNLFPDSVVASEVKVKGHSRERRIDLLIKAGNRIYLIKALSDIGKLPYYSRSYDEIIACYSERYHDFTFEKRIIVSDKVQKEAASAGYATDTVNSLIERIINGNIAE